MSLSIIRFDEDDFAMGIRSLDDLKVKLEEVSVTYKSITDQFAQNPIINSLPTDLIDAAVGGLKHIRDEGIKDEDLRQALKQTQEHVNAQPATRKVVAFGKK